MISLLIDCTTLENVGFHSTGPLRRGALATCLLCLYGHLVSKSPHLIEDWAMVKNAFRYSKLNISNAKKVNFEGLSHGVHLLV